MKKNLLIIPSIDIHNGRTVRVVQGIPEINSKSYDNDPVEMALIWRAENAKCIHVVDFNASQDDTKVNLELIGEICDSVIIPVTVGGGIRSFEYAKELFEVGVYRLVIGSLAHNDSKEFKKILNYFGPQRIVSGIDVIENEVVVSARGKRTGKDPVKYAKELCEFGVERFIVTDVNRNGMLEGPNIELSKNIAIETGCKVTLSGGVSSVEDLFAVKENMKYGIDSVIIGRALYENKFSCQKIWRKAESGLFD